LPAAPTGAIQTQLRAQLENWRGLLGEEMAWTRQLIQKLLVEKVTLLPVTDADGQPAYEVRARFHYGRCVSELLRADGCPVGVASPTGLPLMYDTLLGRFSRAA
jgi:hypothetical protein